MLKHKLNGRLLGLSLFLFACSSCKAGDIDPVPYPAKNLGDAKKQKGFIAELVPAPKTISVDNLQLSVADCWIERVKVRKGRNVSRPDFHRICFVLRKPDDKAWREAPGISFGCFDCAKGTLVMGVQYSKGSVVHTIDLTPGNEPSSLALGVRKGNSVSEPLFKLSLPQL